MAFNTEEFKYCKATPGYELPKLPEPPDFERQAMIECFDGLV